MSEAADSVITTVTGRSEHGGGLIEADHLGLEVGGGRRLLNDVCLTVTPGRLVAGLGASGGGKTPLLGAPAGLRRPTAGSVRYGDREKLGRGEIGYVPQDDIVHLDLPLASMLRYAARLRLPATIPAAGVQHRVDDVLAGLGLAGRADLRVGRLSGGERKRASIGVELLTEPRAFFLDEPTSGLDPVTAAELIRRLRELADAGVTVVLSTHDPADAEACDELVVLAADGRLAFTGPPAAACAHFGVDRVQEIYRQLATGSGPIEEPTGPRRSPAPPAARPEPVAAAQPSPRSSERSRPAPRIGPLRQCLVLAWR